ncbi:ubiquinone biosynthesis O-methyltransferase [Heliocybe sulcata]|uniref:Ubiquinone biosynthesis O-methyltransferase, mitochondrial n=1 Tax=Heliocybe sulcata TaxID=5364 RepID=A0A5C3NH23_9AGAM|nr:ubiquinone biosynthesis O-methyltransferase [Heliocybe sulcata]
MSYGSNLGRQGIRHALKRRLPSLTPGTPSRAIHESNSGISSVNADEIGFFSRLSQQWWDEHGEFSFLHKMNPIRMQFIREKMLEIAREEQGEEAAVDMQQGANLLKGLDVVDVGCGGGLLSESLARLGGRTLGIDASESNISIASLHAAADPRLSSPPPGSSGSLTYQYTSAEDLLQGVQRFDVVCSMEVLEHVDNPAGFLSSCAELLKPGGHLFLSTIARTPLSYALTILAAEHILRKVTVGTHSYSKYVNSSELVEFFHKYRSPSSKRTWITRTYEHGLPARTEAEARGMVYLPWKGAWTLAPRMGSAFGAATACNYLFWVKKPKSD